MTETTTTSAPITQVCTWNSLFPYSVSPEADGARSVPENRRAADDVRQKSDERADVHEVVRVGKS